MPHRPPPRSCTLPRPPSSENAVPHPQVVDPHVPRDHSRDKALLVAAQEFPVASPLSTPRSDQENLYKDLIYKGFKPGNIHRLVDNHPDDYWRPTKANIVCDLTHVSVPYDEQN